MTNFLKQDDKISKLDLICPLTIKRERLEKLVKFDPTIDCKMSQNCHKYSKHLIYTLPSSTPTTSGSIPIRKKKYNPNNVKARFFCIEVLGVLGKLLNCKTAKVARQQIADETQTILDMIFKAFNEAADRSLSESS